MIKVGQIYKTITGNVATITIIGREKFCIISPDGSVSQLPIQVANKIEKQATLLRAYPTWQEAVNSPEFRGLN